MMCLPEPIVRLAPHPGERGNAEDGDQSRSCADQRPTGPARVRHLRDGAALAPFERPEALLGHDEGEEDGQQDGSDAAENDRKPEVDHSQPDRGENPDDERLGPI